MEYPQAVEDRIPVEWGKSIDVPEAWYEIISDLNTKLAEIDPDYSVEQVKTKFGGLRYYFTPSEGISDQDRDRMNALVGEAEEAAYALS